MEPKIEITGLGDAIAEAVYTRLVPLLKSLIRPEAEDIIFDVKGISDYMHVSKNWIYQRTHEKTIPHLKIDGQLRFRKMDIDKWISSFNIPVTHAPIGKLKMIKRK